MQTTIRIIGIDPGLRRTGWGIIETLGNSLRFVASGTVTSDGDMDLASRLCQLHDGLAEVVHSYQPHEAAVEQTFVNKDATATLKLGQARGIAGTRRPQGRRICAERGQEGGDRCRPWREAADPHDAEGSDAEGRVQGQRCGGRTGDRYLPCPQPAIGDEPACRIDGVVAPDTIISDGPMTIPEPTARDAT
jgi:hypothetical protein